MSIPPDFFSFTQYTFNPFSIAPFLVALISSIQGIFIFISEAKTHLNRVIALTFFVASFWALTQAVMLSSLNSSSAFVWAYLMYTAIIFLPAILYHFSVMYTQKEEQQKFLLWFVYLQAGFLAVINFQSLFISDILITSFGLYPRAGVYTPILFLFMVACFLISSINFLSFYVGQSSLAAKKQTRFFILVFWALQFSFIDVLTSYNSSIYPSGYIFLLAFILSMMFFKIRLAYEAVQEKALLLEKAIAEKTKEVSQAVEELKATQIKLMETGKISALASLSAGILHQFSQPITAIHGFVRFIKKEMKPDETFYQPICLIEEQSSHLKKMLEDLMTLVRHREIKKENVSVNEILKKSVNLLTDELRIRRINWDLDLSENMPLVFGDAVQLQQMFMNVLIYTMQNLSELPKGEFRHMRISSEYHTVENQIWILTKDTATDLSEEDMDHIFEPLYTTKMKTSTVSLSLCQDLAAEHGGSIGVHGHPKGGNTFIIRLPAVINMQKAV